MSWVLVTFAALAAPTAWLSLRTFRFTRRLPAQPRGHAIVVLGAALGPGGKPSPAFEGRIERAVELWRAGAAPLVVFSGGGRAGRPTESSAALAHALALGLDAAACLLEEESRSTAENARFTARLLQGRGVTEVVVVTDAFHLPRAVAWFAAVGFKPVPAASRRRLAARTQLYCTLREVVAHLRTPPRPG